MTAFWIDITEYLVNSVWGAEKNYLFAISFIPENATFGDVSEHWKMQETVRHFFRIFSLDMQFTLQVFALKSTYSDRADQVRETKNAMRPFRDTLYVRLKIIFKQAMPL